MTTLSARVVASRSGRVLGSACAVLALVGGLAGLAAVSAVSDELPRLLKVRFGAHPDFDRLVLELDRAAPVVRPHPSEQNQLVLLLGASPGDAVGVREPDLRRMKRVVVAQAPDGTRIEIRATKGRSRVFQLRDPVRIVVDFADPRTAAFAIPSDALPIPAAAAAPEPEPRVTQAPAPTPEPVVVVEPEPTPEPVAVVEPEPTPKPVAVVEPEPEPTPKPVAVVEPEPQPDPDPEPVVVVEPAPEPPPVPEPPTPDVSEARESPAPTPVVPEPAPAGDEPGGPELTLESALWISLGLVGGLGALWLVVRRWRTPSEAAHRYARGGNRRGPPPPNGEPIPIHEVVQATDRLDLLEKRIDEEVRARMVIEERVMQVQEDMKIIRDRLNRLVRSG